MEKALKIPSVGPVMVTILSGDEPSDMLMRAPLCKHRLLVIQTLLRLMTSNNTHLFPHLLHCFSFLKPKRLKIYILFFKANSIRKYKKNNVNEIDLSNDAAHFLWEKIKEKEVNNVESEWNHFRWVCRGKRLEDLLITFPCISSLSVSVTFRPPSKVISSLSDILSDFRSLWWILCREDEDVSVC